MNQVYVCSYHCCESGYAEDVFTDKVFDSEEKAKKWIISEANDFLDQEIADIQKNIKKFEVFDTGYLQDELCELDIIKSSLKIDENKNGGQICFLLNRNDGHYCWEYEVFTVE